jgi:tripartite-type tricarboxylate transporter receptor subunit TctC
MNHIQTSLKRRNLIQLAALSSFAHAPVFSQSNTFPNKPIRLVVGFAAGGAADAVARVLATKVKDKLGQAVVVDNRPGVGGMLAADHVAKSAPDGYTLMLADDGQLSISQGLSEVREKESDSLFEPILGVTGQPIVLVVNSSVPVTNLKELITLLRSKPGQLNFASAGSGNISHMAGELFKHLSKTFMLHIPYRGGAPGVLSVISGETQMMFPSVATAAPHVRSGKLKAIAIVGERRSELLPDVPTAIEAGLPNMRADSWHGVVAPKGLSPQTAKTLNEAFLWALNDADVVNRLKALGLEVKLRNSGEFAQLIKSDAQKWRSLLLNAKLKIVTG